jgi:hypothetical protein
MRASNFRWITTVLFAAVLVPACVVLQGGRSKVAAAEAPASSASPATPAPAAADKDDDDDAPSAMDQAQTPEQKMQARFPQPVRVGELIGQPLLDGEHSTIGYVRQVVRTPAGKIQLIISYRPWASWAQFLTSYDVRDVAVPIEFVGSMGPALSSIDMEHGSYNGAPTWTPGKDQVIPANDVIQIAIARE